MTPIKRASSHFPRPAPLRSGALPLLPLLIAAGAARAAAPADAPQAELETVTIVARAPRPLADTQAAVALVTAPQIEDALARDLADLVRFEPTIAVRNDATRFGSDAVSIRGVGGNRVLILTDGVPSPPGFAIGNFSDSGREFADLDVVRRMEVLKGPASSMYGSSALGGVIAIETLTPRDLLGGGPGDDDDGRVAGRLRAAWDSDAHGRLLGGTLAAGTPRVEALAAASRRESDELQNEWRTLDANPRDSRSTQWLGKLVASGMEQPLQLAASGRQRHVLTDVRSLLLQPGRFANTIAMRGDDRSDGWRVALGQQRLDTGAFDTLQWRLYLESTRVAQQTFESRRAVAATRTPAVDLYRRFDYSDRTGGGQLQVSLAPRSGHRLMAGIDLASHEIRESRDGLQTTPSTGATTALILGENFPLRDFPVTRVREAGLWLADEWRPDGSRLSISPSVRVDDYRLEPRPDAIYVADNPTQVPVRISQTSASPRLGIGWRLREATTLFLQYAHGFRSPPFEDVNIGLDLPQFLTRAIPNPDLRPERSDSYELGLRAAGDGVLQGTVSAFVTRYRDLIESKVNLGRDPLSGYTIFQSRNRARARIEGAELDGRADLGRWRGALQGWSLRLSLAWTRGDDTATNRPLNTIDPPRGIFALRYAAPHGRWHLEGVLTAVAAQDRLDESTTPLAHAGGHATIDLLGRYAFSDRLELRAGLFNLADRRYVEWADIRGRAPNDPQLDLYTRPGRSVSLSLTAHLGGR
ncbi:MAG: TonB-dependent hemoglobin/transferrin/lactoferrin family receptor [Planctomycetota bacterium]